MAMNLRLALTLADTAHLDGPLSAHGKTVHAVRMAMNLRLALTLADTAHLDEPLSAHGKTVHGSYSR